MIIGVPCGQAELRPSACCFLSLGLNFRALEPDLIFPVQGQGKNSVHFPDLESTARDFLSLGLKFLRFPCPWIKFSRFPCPWTEFSRFPCPWTEILNSVQGQIREVDCSVFPVPGLKKINSVLGRVNSVSERGNSMPRYAALLWPQGTPIIKTKKTLRRKPYEGNLTESECRE